jgi:RNase H-fold protein (predicted Holliday junction resolvase)
MQEQKVRAKARRNVVNQIAAVLILQAYLEGHCLNAPPPDLP